MLSKLLQSAAGAGASNAWDISKASYSPPSSLVWDTQTMKYSNIGRGLTETAPQGIFFKPDGLKMYIVGNTGDSVYEYILTTAWLVNTASINQTYSITQDTTPNGITFKPDGTKMYLVGSVNDSVYEYSLSTAWDISTLSYVQAFSVTAKEATPNGISFKTDGLNMYIVGSSSDSVHQYSLSTAWNISTATFVQTYVLNASETSHQDIFFKPDGTKFYVIGTSTDLVYQYTLGTAWDISTVNASSSFSVASQEPTPNGLCFKPDGTQMYIVGSTNDTVYQYVMGGLAVGNQDGSMNGISFKPDGTKMYLIGASNDAVFEYSLSSAWDVSTASYQKNFSIAARDTSPTGLFFKSDGLKMYFIGNVNDSVYEYSLSTAWDTSTLSYVRTCIINDTSPNGLFFSSDGTQMYVAANNLDAVLQYTLSTAWNISTATYIQRKYIDTEEVTIHDVFFKPDGKTMFIAGQFQNKINSYSLTTAWDISTATYSKSFDMSGQEPSATGIFFKDDGLKFFMCGSINDCVFQYSIS